MTLLRAFLRQLWRRFLPRARISVRIVTAVILAMSVVLVAAGAFVYWRVSYALDRQLDQDLTAYTKVVHAAVAAGEPLPANDPGLVAQTYTTDGRLISTSDPGVRDLITSEQAREADGPRSTDIGRFVPPPSKNPYRVTYQPTKSPDGRRVVATAISRHKHDEALRELLLQLAIADLATVAAAGLVGWGATRAALGPVENYRRAALAGGGDPTVRLPIDPDHDDELARLGTTFNELLSQIEAGHRRERQFLADASHELRSPLALLAAEVEWAKHRPRTTAEVEEVLTSIGDQTTRLAALADALLRLEEAGEAKSTASLVSLSGLIETAVEPHRATATSLDRRIQVNASDAVVTVEERWVAQAVSNLVGNALRHGQGAVNIDAKVHADDQIRVEVTDQGPGIPPELGATAFERFARAEQSRTTPGHGLGLAIVAAVAHRHHGSASLIPNGVRLDLGVKPSSTPHDRSDLNE